MELRTVLGTYHSWFPLPTPQKSLKNQTRLESNCWYKSGIKLLSQKISMCCSVMLEGSKLASCQLCKELNWVCPPETFGARK